MLLVALTGGIAVGKSVAAAVFKELGCYVHSSDTAAHELMRPDSSAWDEIVRLFGKDILNPDRTIDRKRLSRMVFADEAKRRSLNKILHPRVMESRRNLLESLDRRGNHSIFISEAALTLEAGFASFYDRIIVVFCDEHLQMKRLLERKGISRAEAQRMIQSQMPQEEKKRYAHYLIDSSGSIDDTVERTESVFRLLVQDYMHKQC